MWRRHRLGDCRCLGLGRGSKPCDRFTQALFLKAQPSVFCSNATVTLQMETEFRGRASRTGRRTVLVYCTATDFLPTHGNSRTSRGRDIDALERSYAASFAREKPTAFSPSALALIARIRDGTASFHSVAVSGKAPRVFLTVVRH